MNQRGNNAMGKTTMIRFTQSQRKLIERYAEAKNLTLSQAVRQILQDYVDKHKHELK